MTPLPLSLASTRDIVLQKSGGFDHSPKGFHPENEPLNKDKFAAKKLEKGPNGPGMNDKGPWSKLDKTWKENLEAAKAVQHGKLAAKRFEPLFEKVR